MPKKTFPIIFIILIFTMPPLHGNARSFLNLTGNFFTSSDGVYKDIYGASIVLPELTAAVFMGDHFFIWGGAAFFSKKGLVLGELNLESKSERSFFSIGLGYKYDLSMRQKLLIRGGGIYLGYKERVLNSEISGSKLGIKLEADVLSYFYESVFFVLKLGYVIGDDSVDTDSGTYQVKLSGMTAGIGFGFSF